MLGFLESPKVRKNESLNGRFFKIKKPSLNFQKDIIYELIKENKTTCWLRVLDTTFIYKNVSKKIITEILK